MTEIVDINNRINNIDTKKPLANANTNIEILNNDLEYLSSFTFTF